MPAPLVAAQERRVALSWLQLLRVRQGAGEGDEVKTTKDERAMWGSVGRFARIPTQDVYHLIADVDDAVGLFERVLSGSADGLLLGEIRTFLKEPKQ